MGGRVKPGHDGASGANIGEAINTPSHVAAIA